MARMDLLLSINLLTHAVMICLLCWRQQLAVQQVAVLTAALAEFQEQGEAERTEQGEKT
jgi:hypothetical protein